LPFPSPKRIEVDIINKSYARIRCDGYFAVTTNTVQFGSHSEFFFGFSALNLSGSSGFDALIQFSPFHFTVDISTSFSVNVFGIGCYGIDMDLTLEGPTLWPSRECQIRDGGRLKTRRPTSVISMPVQPTWQSSCSSNLLSSSPTTGLLFHILCRPGHRYNPRICRHECFW
jgi:hypothetical protein